MPVVVLPEPLSPTNPRMALRLPEIDVANGADFGRFAVQQTA